MQENPFGQNPAGAPPIPAPEALQQTVVVAHRDDWQTVPVVVRGWAYTLSFLGMIGGIGFMLVGFFNDESMGEKIVGIIIGVLFFAMNFWLRKAIRSGARGAWNLQIVLSAFGLLGFPLGTLVHGYILSNWFKPEVKAWFGVK